MKKDRVYQRGRVVSLKGDSHMRGRIIIRGPCGKAILRSGKEAKNSLKAMIQAERNAGRPVDDLNAYWCRTCCGWHVGHLPESMKEGGAT